jgi:hypothetical protein
MRKSSRSWLPWIGSAALIVVGVACDEEPTDLRTGEGIFLAGCPRQGLSMAMQLEDPAQRMTGPDALGGPGDYLLMNENAAFVVQGLGRPKTYFYYPGVLIDAVEVSGCEQASPERFGELTILPGKLDVRDFASSILRGFKGESFEILSDGRDGRAAIVRVRGVDDVFWIAELDLIKDKFKSGTEKLPSQPFGVKLEIDYILPPRSNVLTIEFRVKNETSEWQELVAGAALIVSDTLQQKMYADGKLSLGGFHVRMGIPWLAASGDDGSYAFAMDTDNMGLAHISGVDALLDTNQVASPLYVEAKGMADTAQMRYFVSAGGTDTNSAVRHLAAVNTQLPAYELFTLEGRTVDLGTGQAIAGAALEVQLKNSKGEWMTVDALASDGNGDYDGEVAAIGSAERPYRIVARSPGRPHPEPAEFVRAASVKKDVLFGAAGTLAYQVKDQDGVLLPSLLSFYRDGQLVREVAVTSGMGELALPPAEYELSVTRGIEYPTHQGKVSIQAGQKSTLEVTLPHLVDTRGFLSIDTHVHAGPSADSTISVADRIATVGAAGLDVVVSTDHEVVVDWKPGVVETGLQDWVATVIGEEVTATLPEHTIMFPVSLAGMDDPRGEFVRWYGLDIGQIYAAERARGAQVVQLNHPRHGCNYMCLVGYDRLAGKPRLEDATGLGMPEGASLWSWDFNTIEYQNSPRNVFMDPKNPDATGLFDDWQSFLNHGHRVTALGVSDAHSESIGIPRTYFASSTDRPADLKEADLVASMQAGRVVVSTGAFARATVNGTATLGDTVTDKDGTVELKIHIEAIPEIDVTYFKVFANCDQVATVAATDPDELVKYDGTLEVAVASDAHLTVLGFGSKPMPRGLENYDPTFAPRFTTNAIFVDADGNGRYDAPGGKVCTYDQAGP